MSKTTEIITKVQSEKRTALLETEAKMICEDYDIPVTKFKLAKNEQEAIEFAQEIGYPIVLKIVSPDIIHKSDAGGVKVNLKTEEEVKNAYNQILKNAKNYSQNAEIKGILVQEMAPQSTEVIIGSVKDPTFGQTVMFGLGGVFVELLKDVTFRLAPVAEYDALEMIKELKAYPLLKGFRNNPTVDIDSLVNIILKTSNLIMEHSEIKEADLNPVMAYEKGAKTVDARIILEA